MTDNAKPTEEIWLDTIRVPLCCRECEQKAMMKMKEIILQQREGYEQRIKELDRPRCAFCNWGKDLEIKTFGELQNHMKECPFHPMRNLEQRIRALKEAGDDLYNWIMDSDGFRKHWDEVTANWQKAKEEGGKK